MARINVTLSNQEIEALIVLAGMEIRHPRAQAALIIRKELERLGLIAITKITPAVAVESVTPAAEKEINDGADSDLKND